MMGATAQAIVAGAGLAGLLAAHALARNGFEVVVLETDRILSSPQYRPGTPQARHPHGLLQRGADTLEHLLPGFSNDLQAGGAHVFDFGTDARVLFPAGWAPSVPTRVRHHAASRELVETTVRRRVLAHAAITLREGTKIAGLLWHPAGNAVSGVVDADGTRYEAELVVIATGRTSRLNNWLAQAERRPPTTRRVTAQLSYTSRVFACTRGYSPDWKLTAELAYAPDRRHGGVAVRIEGDLIQLTLIGADRERAPRDEDGFRAYARELRNPDFLAVITNARPLSPITRYGGLDNHWHPYHRMRQWPDGLLAVGDAVCTLNPIYGHGMTIAALHAAALDHLAGRVRTRPGPHFAHAFQQAAASAIRVPWQLAAYSDIGWQPAAAGMPVQLAHRAVRRLVDRIPHDRTLYRRFIDVQNLLAHPATLALPPLRRKERA